MANTTAGAKKGWETRRNRANLVPVGDFTSELRKPEIVQAIIEIGPPMKRLPRYEIPNAYYAIWLIGTTFAVFCSFFIGMSVYR